jgi:DNA-binding winged helix-turn-helix (wHTH) protein
MIYRFGECELDLARGELRRGGESVALQPKPLALLVYLIEERHRVIAKDELLEKIWSEVAVTESSLTRAISVMRKAIGDRGDKSFIRSYARRGYRFVGAVSEAGGDETDGLPTPESFIGRDNAFATLQASWQRASAGSGQVVIVRGEAGIGKSRLSEAFGEGIRRQGASVLEGRADGSGSAPAFWLWLQVLAELPGAKDDPMIGPLLAQGGAAPQESPEHSQFELFDSVARLLREHVSREPGLLVLDDIHWSSRSSLLLLEHLATRIQDQRLLIVATVRDEPRERSHPLNHTMGQLSQSGALNITLDGFSRDEIQRWLASLMGREAPARLIDELMRRTEGNPLFLREAVRMLEDQGQLDFPETGDWQLDALPERTADIVQQRFISLPADAGRVLEAAAVLGREFTVAAAAAVTEDAAAELLDALDEAVIAGVVEEVRDRPGSYRFAHPLFREGVYGELRPGQRARLHARVAEVLAGPEGDPDPTVLSEWAHHLHRALAVVEPEQVFAAAERAAGHARRLLAWEQEAHHYDQALDALAQLPSGDERRRLRLLLSLGEARGRSGDREGRREALLQALELARALADDEGFVSAAILLCELSEWAPHDPDAVAVLTDALERVTDAEVLRSRVLARRGYLTLVQRRRGEVMVREALELARAAKDPTAIVEAASCLHLMVAGPEGIEQRGELTEEMRLAADSPGLRDLAAIACLGSATDAWVEERARDARHFRELAAELAGTRPQRALVHQLAVHDAGLDLLRGDLEQADQAFRKAFALGREIGHPYAPILFVGQAMYTARERGTLAEVHQRLPDPIHDDVSQIQISPFVVAINAAIWAEAGRTEIATPIIEFFGPAIERLEGRLDWVAAAVELANGVRFLGDTDRARILLEMLEPKAALHGMCTITALYGGPVARSLGLLAELLEELHAAEGWLEEGVARAEALGARAMAARTRCDLARVIARRGRSGPARELFERAEQEAMALGMQGVAAEARDALVG